MKLFVKKEKLLFCLFSIVFLSCAVAFRYKLISLFVKNKDFDAIKGFFNLGMWSGIWIGAGIILVTVSIIEVYRNRN